MSTHRITDTTKIPLPCWLRRGHDGVWEWRTSVHEYPEWKFALAGWTHYSDNPESQRPEDINAYSNRLCEGDGDLKPIKVGETSPTPDLARLAEQTEKWKAQFEAEHQLVLTAYDQLRGLRARVAELEAMLIKEQDYSHELRVDRERLTKELKQTQDATDAAIRLINECSDQRGSLDNKNIELSALRAEVEKWKTDHARLQMELDASCNAEELRQVRAENERLRQERDAAQSAFASKESELAKSRAYSEDRDETIAALHRELEELQGVVAATRQLSIDSMNEIRIAAGAPIASEDKSNKRAVDYVTDLAKFRARIAEQQDKGQG